MTSAGGMTIGNADELRQWLDSAAFAFATAELRQAHFAGTRWGPHSPLSPEGGHAFARAILRASVLSSPAGGAYLIALARAGVADAQAILRDLLVDRRSRGIPVPAELERYERDLLRGSLPGDKPGEKKSKRLLRDIVIIVTIEGIRKAFDIAPTSSSKRRRSGCAIVAEALGTVGVSIGAKSVERIWAQYGANAAWLPALPPSEGRSNL